MSEIIENYFVELYSIYGVLIFDHSHSFMTLMKH